jgi:alanine racemase
MSEPELITPGTSSPPEIPFETSDPPAPDRAALATREPEVADRTLLHARTWVDIDLERLGRNLDAIRALLPPGVETMLVVKANAYGHGQTAVAWHLARRGVGFFGVGDSSEALALRAAGITTPILILGAVVPGELEDVIRHRVSVTVHSADRVRALRAQIRRTGGRAAVHLKVDTGMGRLGCAPERVLGIAREIRRSAGVRFEGIATHLATLPPDDGGEATRQVRRFQKVVAALEADGLAPRWRHAFASGAILSRFPDLFNLVRPGIAVYGIDPLGQGRAPLAPVLSWRTQVVFLKDHRKGSRIGYGGTWTAPRKSRIATLPVGYDDGYRFALSNKAEVLLRGRRCPVVGRVSMDYITVDVTEVPGARVGDTVTLLGRDGNGEIRVEELAAHVGTIPYEILCGIGPRVKRRYLLEPGPEASPAAG